ncbi:MAG TPA: hypothetical protein VM686_40260, partial [Polyangiaceae bacterium]|nr:hypothetical protein [Polyangiaceae bacterium]
MLSSHPLPLAALAGTALRRIFEETPPTPRVALKKQRRGRRLLEDTSQGGASQRGQRQRMRREHGLPPPVATGRA